MTDIEPKDSKNPQIENPRLTEIRARIAEIEVLMAVFPLAIAASAGFSLFALAIVSVLIEGILFGLYIGRIADTDVQLQNKQTL